MKLRDTTRKIISLLEERSNYPGRVVKDKSLATFSALILARPPLLATRGLETIDPAAKHTLKNMAGNFSGLQLACYEFVAFKQFAPEQNIGFDLSAEYETAMQLFGK
jgi:hypothetical protein